VVPSTRTVTEDEVTSKWKTDDERRAGERKERRKEKEKSKEKAIKQ
jgi:hypothetical protein